MQLIKEKQVSPIESEVLTSLLIGIKQDILDELGGLDKVKLKMLPRAFFAFEMTGICSQE